MHKQNGRRGGHERLELVAVGGAIAGATLTSANAARAEQITWWAPNWGQTRAEALVKQFEIVNPGTTVKVEITVADGLQNRAVVALRSGSPPDLIAINASWNVPFAANHQLMDLGDFIAKSHTDLADFLPATLSVSKVGDALYGIPYRAETVGPIYNKATYKAAGLDPEKPLQTWTELLDVSKQLTRKSANGQQQYGYGLVGGGEVANMVTRAMAYVLMNSGSLSRPMARPRCSTSPPLSKRLTSTRATSLNMACLRRLRSKMTGWRCGACSYPARLRNTSLASTTSRRSAPKRPTWISA